MKRRAFTAILAIASLVLGSCGGGGGGGGGSSPTPPPSTPVYTAPGAQSLSVSDVEQVIAQAVAEAKARSLPAVIAVTDRVGNVLAVYSMTGAPSSVTITPGPGGNFDAQGLVVPATYAAIAKAVTGAYLSSGGNAFSTRTASEIIQPNFPAGPAFAGLESGPLFGVQFSQLPCSDLSQRYSASATPAQFIGPKRSPLGLAGDPGGFPLYKSGVLVGGVGIMANPVYSFDANFSVTKADAQEAIALAGTVGFDAPSTITADKVSIAGTSLDYSDTAASDLKSNPASAPAYASLGAGTGALTAVANYYGGSAVISGETYGAEASGVRPATTAEFNDPDAWVLTDGTGNNRFPASAGTDGADVASPLTTSETKALLQQAFSVMAHTRAGIRNPLNSRAQVSISVVDTRGSILGIVRAPDAPMFGADVSLQKARTAAFFSGPSAGSDLTGNTDPTPAKKTDIAGFTGAFRTFLGDPNALTGKTAISVRAIGNLSRPYFPDGQSGTPNGPLSRPISQWSIFSTGLQTALIATDLTGPDRGRCTYLPDVAAGHNRLQNGLQIFSGGVPIYRGGVLIGAIGVSGDGVDQDDMIAFLGLYNAGTSTGTINQPAAAIRSDQLVVNGVRLRYVNCPTTPFVDSSQQNVCAGI